MVALIDWRKYVKYFINFDNFILFIKLVLLFRHVILLLFGLFRGWTLLVKFFLDQLHHLTWSLRIESQKEQLWLEGSWLFKVQHDLCEGNA